MPLTSRRPPSRRRVHPPDGGRAADLLCRKLCRKHQTQARGGQILMTPSRDKLSRFCIGAVRRSRHASLREGGFTLIEMLIAMSLLLIVSPPLVTVMTTGIVTNKFSRERA